MKEFNIIFSNFSNPTNLKYIISQTSNEWYYWFNEKYVKMYS